MTTRELHLLAENIANWADGHPAIARVYLFGSRVRGDHAPDSDVDLFVEWVNAPDNIATDLWCRDVDDDFAKLKSVLPGRLSLHCEANDGALPAIHGAAKNPTYSVRKVICVSTPPHPHPIRHGRA